MKAVVYQKYGAPEVLHVSDIEKPQPKDNELLIKVRATEVTKSDCEMRSFKFPVKWFWLPLRLVIGITKPRRNVLGGYFAGEVEAVGARVTNFKVGDKIFGNTGLSFGAYGEYVCLPQNATLAHMPDNADFAQAASVPLGGLNALHFMRLANINAGENVLINGAGGSIGMFALQIANDMGAAVTVVDKGSKEEMLRNIGVVDFIDYTKEDFTKRGQTYDVVFDMVAQSSLMDCDEILKPNGRYLTGNPQFANMIKCILANRFSDRTATFSFAKETVEELNTLKTLIEEGRITPIVDKIFPMEDAAEAHHLVETEQRLGAIVLSVAK
jgi:NADPH:quinone reductase-like Zn-dependent oxidoreductase